MITRWNTKVGTEYEVDPRGWAWAWVSPDIMVDTDNDLLEDGSVFFGQNNKLKVRLRNRGNAAASNIQVDLWYQKATPFLTTAGWIPVQNAAGVTQQLSGLSLAVGADGWFAADWAPVDDGTHHSHWCVKARVTVAGDPNTDNKMAFRNFDNVAVGGPDTTIQTLIRFVDWTEGDRLQVIPRGPKATLVVTNQGIFPKALPHGCDPQAYEARTIHGVPLDLVFAELRVEPSDLPAWDGAVTSDPETSGAYYPIDPATLPPGVDPAEVVAVAHLRDGRPFGGVSYRLR
jgi:hypothetical protein